LIKSLFGGRIHFVVLPPFCDAFPFVPFVPFALLSGGWGVASFAVQALDPLPLFQTFGAYTPLGRLIAPFHFHSVDYRS
jgi:hypothetical protein